MAQAKVGDSVQVHYKGTLADGAVFDSSENREPLTFKLGEGQVIPGFEQGIIGMNPGESKTVHIPCDRAYGPYHDELKFEAPVSQLPEGFKPAVGEQLRMQQPEGQSFVVAVSSVTETSVMLDANHPLAGKDLTFDIQLVAIA